MTKTLNDVNHLTVCERRSKWRKLRFMSNETKLQLASLAVRGTLN
ncbi:MAG: hypothetical protein ACTS7D_01635 [Candidatus Hodgkinia cicadicola]